MSRKPRDGARDGFDDDDMASTAEDAPVEATDAAVEPANPSWVYSYNSLTAKLPRPLAERLPSGDKAATTLALAQDRLAAFGNSSKERWDTVSRTAGERVAELRAGSSRGVTSVQDAWLAKAWSVTNETQVPLNVALRQVRACPCQDPSSPHSLTRSNSVIESTTCNRSARSSTTCLRLVQPLNDEFVRGGTRSRARKLLADLQSGCDAFLPLPYLLPANLWFSLEVRPYTSPSTAYNGWSATWPILCVTGPAVAVTSLLAIPFVAAATGGTLLASLSSFGSSIVSGAGAAAESVGAAAATAAGLATKANAIPGASRVKGKLADAARDLVGEHISREKVQQHVVRYLTQGGGGKGKGKEGEAATVGMIEEAQAHEVEKTREKARKDKKLDEVDVTGFDVEKVLTCSTGHAGVDKVRHACQCIFGSRC